MLTCSQLIDQIALETRRAEIVSLGYGLDYLNQTIRELHAEPIQGNMTLYAKNLHEIALTADVDSGFTWQIPDLTRFQRLQAVRYSSLMNILGEPIYAKMLKPGRIMNQETWYYYQTGEYFAFYNYGGDQAEIDLAYYQFLPWLKYYAVGSRPATYDLVDGFTYYDLTSQGGINYDLDDDTRALARELTTNWLILGYYTCIQEGLRAKVFKRNSDTERARTAYSLYSTLRKGVYTTEACYFGN
jgi:hypothetical protein